MGTARELAEFIDSLFPRDYFKDGVPDPGAVQMKWYRQQAGQVGYIVGELDRLPILFLSAADRAALGAAKEALRAALRQWDQPSRSGHEPELPASHVARIHQLLVRGATPIGTMLADIQADRATPKEDIVTKVPTKQPSPRKRIFIGHGRSTVWRDLRDFLVDRLRLRHEEYNREAVAGLARKERLSKMLEEAGFAFIVMTAEDQHADGGLHARENVIHECGLFQGRLGFERAIVLLEEGCSEFSNIEGLEQLRFPKGKIMAVSEEIRRVLEREGIIKPRSRRR
jgi:predicted nucleotide-binding protein